MHVRTEPDYLEADESGLSTSLVGMVGPDLARQFQKDMFSEQAARVFLCTQRQREIAAQQRQGGPRHAMAGGARHTMEIDLEAFLEWQHREAGCWSDKQFLREFARDNEDCRIQQAGVGAGNRVAWTPESETWGSGSRFQGIILTDKRGTPTDVYEGGVTLMESLAMQASDDRVLLEGGAA